MISEKERTMLSQALEEGKKLWFVLSEITYLNFVATFLFHSGLNRHLTS